MEPVGAFDRASDPQIAHREHVRAFEVEHTTAIYSGLLRMADLLALQPNMNIKLHIVAPEERKEKVFTEIRRPVFSLLERAPLSECCTYLSYDSLRELAKVMDRRSVELATQEREWTPGRWEVAGCRNPSRRGL